MPFNEELPEWKKDNPDARPAQAKLDAGWAPMEKPPASMWNWFANRTYRALKQLFDNAIHKEEKGVPNGVAKLGPDGKLSAGQENTVTIPDASTTVKGITMLSNGISGTSQVKAGTELAVRDAKEAAINWAKGFGLGSLAKAISNLDTTLAETGFYLTTTGALNTPPGAGVTGSVLQIYRNSTSVTQMYADMNNAKMYVRVKNGSTWGAWAELESITNKNQPNGYVGLDANSKLNPAQLPDATRLDLEYLKINYSNY